MHAAKAGIVSYLSYSVELIKARYILSPSLARMYPMVQPGSHLHLCSGQPLLSQLKSCS